MPRTATATASTYSYRINKIDDGKAPCCYSCQEDRYMIKGFCCVNDQTGERHYVCIDCLDCYTCIDSKLDVYDIDWTERKNLIKLRAYHCKHDGDLFITAHSGQEYRLKSLGDN